MLPSTGTPSTASGDRFSRSSKMPEHVDVPPGDRLVDQLLGVRGRADQHDVRGQPVQPAPPPDQHPPAGVQHDQAGRPRRPSTTGHPVVPGSGGPQQRRGGRAPRSPIDQGEPHHLRHLVRPGLAAVEPVAARCCSAGDQQQGADDERHRLHHRGTQQRSRVVFSRTSDGQRGDVRSTSDRAEGVRGEPAGLADPHRAQMTGRNGPRGWGGRGEGGAGASAGAALSPSVVTRSTLGSCPPAAGEIDQSWQTDVVSESM